MKKIMQNITLRQAVLAGSGMLSLILCLIFVIVNHRIAAGLDAQNMAARWSKDKDVAQVSCFFSKGADVSKESIEQFEHGLDKALEQAAVSQKSENASARLWVDAYSAEGRITITSERTTMEVNAVGVGGDFFLFHPLKLLFGNYFSGSDLMQDHVVLDEDAAWQLFGSGDIAGKYVIIGGVPHVVSGVIERDKGRLEEAAGLNSSVVYVSYETLSRYGMDYGINCYELLMPNPVSGYVKKHVMENIGFGENEIEVVENTGRFSAASHFRRLATFGTHSMAGKAIIYPYWENLARGYEDITGLFFFFVLLFLLYPLVLLIVALAVAYRHRSWTAGELWAAGKDKAERLLEKLRARRAERKEERDYEKAE